MLPKKFRKRPVVIEAMQLVGKGPDWHAAYLWIESNTLGSFEPMDVIEGREPCPASGVSIDPRDGRLIISTLEGLHWADPGDWIIRGVKGEFYPVKDAIFRETYEPEQAPTVRHRDAVTGQYVDADEAAARPETTIRETRKP